MKIVFRISDEYYAVENVVDERKAIATGIIGGNDRGLYGCRKMLGSNRGAEKKYGDTQESFMKPCW